MNKRTYTDEELIRRVWDVEEIKKLANKRVYYQANEWREKELGELWTAEHADTASFGGNTGFYVGLDSIRKWYVAGTKSTGCLTSHPISTGLVELAGDGKTAKGLWYCIGQETVPGKAMWVTGKVAMDFVKEGDAWKIWPVRRGGRKLCQGRALLGPRHRPHCPSLRHARRGGEHPRPQLQLVGRLSLHAQAL